MPDCSLAFSSGDSMLHDATMEIVNDIIRVMVQKLPESGQDSLT